MTEAEKRDLLRAHYAFQEGAFISTVQEIPGGVAAYSEVTPIPMWNNAAWLSGNGAEFQDFLKAAASRDVVKSRRPVIYLSDDFVSGQHLLAQAGFEKFDSEAWMVWSASETPERSANVRRISEPKDLEAFIAAFGASFQTTGTGYARALRGENKSDKSSQRQIRHFALFQDQKIVSVGTLLSEGDLACIYNLGTPPAERRKGYGGAILRHIVAEARSLGSKTIFLQVENESGAKRLYEKCGFDTVFVRLGYRLASWSPPVEKTAHDATRLSTVLGYRSAEIAEPVGFSRQARPLSISASRLQRLFPGDGARNAFIAAWACLVHRYTGDESAAFTVADEKAGSREPLLVSIPRDEAVSNWLRDFAKSKQSADLDAAGEVVLWFRATEGSGHLGADGAPLQLHIPGEALDSIEIVYQPNLFSKDSIGRMAAHFNTLLQSIAEGPLSRVSELEVLPAAEKHQLLVEWNQPAFSPVATTVVQLFESQVERAPDSTALILAETGGSGSGEPRQMTYRQLNRRANRLAHRLREMGAGPESFVGVFLDRSLEMIVSLLAIFKAGAACVPIDPAYPAERISFMVQDAEAGIIITERHLADSLPDMKHARLLLVGEALPPGKSESEKNPAPAGGPHNAAYVIYTSGSTGKPKGVVIPNHAISNHCIDCRQCYGLSPKDRVLQFSSFNFDAAFEQILPALASGACLVLRGKDVWSTREFGQKLGEFQLTVADIPTAYWHELAEEWSADPSNVPPNVLRLVIVGGEALSPEKLARWRQAGLKNVRLINAYGPTETTITAASFEFSSRAESDAGLPDSEIPAVPIGRPRGDRKAYVLDAHGTPVPIGLPGELHIGGSMLARGYHRRPELTASRFIQNPFSDEPEARLYKTGDLVRYREDGNLEFLGRVDDQVKIRGFRIELGEVETALRKHPGVRETMVLARDNRSGTKQLIAYVTKTSEPLSSADLRLFLKGSLPDYMVPAHFVILDRWPLMPNGKVDRRALPEPEAENASGESVNGPRDPLELQLQLLFERVLKRAPIDIQTSFFELGGDSLQALELLVEIEKASGKQLPLGTLYQSSTVESLAREVRGRASEQAWSSLVPLQASGKRPPLFLLHTTPGDILGYGNLVYRLGSEQPCYGFQSLGLNDPRLSHRTVDGMARYYVDLLRSRFPSGPYYLGGWCYGGIVAVEMARMLREQGETVALLALLETVALPPSLSNLAYLRHRLRCLLKMSPGRWMEYVREKSRYRRESRIANKMRFRQVDTSRPEESAGEIIDPRLAKLEHVYNTNLKALNHYKTSYYDGTVTLFNAAENDPALLPDPQYGWVGLAREIEIVEVPGNHDTMLFEPNVSVLASRLNEALERARKMYERGK